MRFTTAFHLFSSGVAIIATASQTMAHPLRQFSNEQSNNNKEEDEYVWARFANDRGAKNFGRKLEEAELGASMSMSGEIDYDSEVAAMGKDSKSKSKKECAIERMKGGYKVMWVNAVIQSGEAVYTEDYGEADIERARIKAIRPVSNSKSPKTFRGGLMNVEMCVTEDSGMVSTPYLVELVAIETGVVDDIVTFRMEDFEDDTDDRHFYGRYDCKKEELTFSGIGKWGSKYDAFSLKKPVEKEVGGVRFPGGDCSSASSSSED